MTAEQQDCEEFANKMGPNPTETSSLLEEPDHTDPVNFQGGRKTSYFLPHPVFKAKGSTITTWIASDGGAKSTSGTKQHASLLIPDGKGTGLLGHQKDVIGNSSHHMDLTFEDWEPQ